MTRPRMTTIASAALASAVAFFVLTRSGLAGTLAGAAVASMVYTGTSHWVGQGIERAARWWLVRRGRVRTDAQGATDPAPDALGTAAPGPAIPAACAACPLSDAPPCAPAPTPAPRPLTVGRLARTWGPVALAVAALCVSGYSLATGSPLERVIVRERVVEKPVVQERVIIQTETVTVTVPHAGGEAGPTTTAPSAGSTTTSSDGSTTTTTTVSSSSTTAPPAGTTTTAPPTTTTATPPVSTTTAPPPAGN